MSPGASTTFSRLSFLCACLIVCLHGDMLDLAAPLARFVQEAIRALYRCALPLFFFMSGYWFVGHAEEEGWWRRALVKRLGTLGVPYVIFITLSLLFYVLRDVVLLHAPLLGGTTGVLRHLGFDLRYPTGDNMWYLRGLFLFFLATPLVLPLVRRSFLLSLALAAGCALLPLHARQPFDDGVGIFWYFGFNAYGFACFLVGMSARFHLDSNTWMRRLAAPLLYALPLALALAVVFPERHLVAFLWQPLIMAGLAALAARLPIPVAWGAFSFPIYALHWFFLATATTLLQRVQPILNSFLGSGLLVASAIVFSIAVSCALRRLAPRVHAVAFGGRSRAG